MQEHCVFGAEIYLTISDLRIKLSKTLKKLFNTVQEAACVADLFLEMNALCSAGRETQAHFLIYENEQPQTRGLRPLH